MALIYEPFFSANKNTWITNAALACHFGDADLGTRLEAASRAAPSFVKRRVIDPALHFFNFVAGACNAIFWFVLAVPSTLHE